MGTVVIKINISQENVLKLRLEPQKKPCYSSWSRKMLKHRKMKQQQHRSVIKKRRKKNVRGNTRWKKRNLGERKRGKRQKSANESGVFRKIRIIENEIKEKRNNDKKN